jgi:hypothetical protein
VATIVEGLPERVCPALVVAERERLRVTGAAQKDRAVHVALAMTHDANAPGHLLAQRARKTDVVEKLAAVRVQRYWSD